MLDADREAFAGRPIRIRRTDQRSGEVDVASVDDIVALDLRRCESGAGVGGQVDEAGLAVVRGNPQDQLDLGHVERVAAGVDEHDLLVGASGAVDRQRLLLAVDDRRRWIAGLDGERCGADGGGEQDRDRDQRDDADDRGGAAVRVLSHVRRVWPPAPS